MEYISQSNLLAFIFLAFSDKFSSLRIHFLFGLYKVFFDMSSVVFLPRKLAKNDTIDHQRGCEATPKSHITEKKKLKESF